MTRYNDKKRYSYISFSSLMNDTGIMTSLANEDYNVSTASPAFTYIGYNGVWMIHTKNSFTDDHSFPLKTNSLQYNKKYGI